MQDVYWKKLEHCLSPDRLGAYGQVQEGHRVIVARYLWNIAISEALYAPLHILEVGLRNAIDRAMVAETGSATWYDSVKATFPYMPKSHHNRKQIKADLDRIRKLRNRVFHHERIIHWKDLPEQHQLILNFLGWLNPDLVELAGIVDDFTAIHAKGTQPYLDKLDRHLDGMKTS